MGRKRIAVGQQSWTIPEGDAAEVLVLIESALKDGSVLRLSLLDDADRQVEVFINGRNTTSVVVDLGAGPRPSEIFGAPTTDGPTSDTPPTTDTPPTSTPPADVPPTTDTPPTNG